MYVISLEYIDVITHAMSVQANESPHDPEELSFIYYKGTDELCELRERTIFQNRPN